MKFSRVFILAGLFLAGGVQVGQAVTSNDYYQAGLQLYVNKDYAHAIQYFDASIQLDPNNAAALQGRASCYYAQGDYQKALVDYQKVLSLNPSNTQLATFVDQVKAKAGASGGAPAAPTASSDVFNQGVALYQQKQYASAAASFQTATQQNPNDAKSYYYLGLSQLMTGDKKNATLALAISNKLSPNPSLGGYVDRLKAGLSPDDQQWVTNNLNQSSSQALSGSPSLSDDSRILGFRLEPGIGLVSLGDFNTDAQTRLASGKAQQAAGDPSYQFSANVPSLYPDITLEPTLKVLPFLEVGLPLSLLMVGSYNLQSMDASVTLAASIGINAFSVGINGRFILSLDNSLKLFVAGGPVVVPISMSVTQSDSSGSPPSTDWGSSSNLAIGAQCQFGADYHLGGGFVVSLYAGYRAASASGFSFTDTYTTGGSSVSETGQFYMIKNGTYGESIQFISDKYLSSLTPGTYRPLNVDLSSVLSGIQISAFF